MQQQQNCPQVIERASPFQPLKMKSVATKAQCPPYPECSYLFDQLEASLSLSPSLHCASSRSFPETKKLWSAPLYEQRVVWLQIGLVFTLILHNDSSSSSKGSTIYWSNTQKWFSFLFIKRVCLFFTDVGGSSQSLIINFAGARARSSHVNRVDV